jgi:hypothetical protein
MERPNNIIAIAAVLSQPNHGVERHESSLSLLDFMGSSQGTPMAMLAEV